MLVFLASGDKPRAPDDIDRIVCAEIPDSITQPHLYEAVVKHMLHECNAKKCMKSVSEGRSSAVGSRCKKGFPKEFVEATTEGDDSYPNYRRRNNGRMVQKGTTVIDNRRVVPYNPYLLLKYDAHVNVEICSSVKAVKYMFKYVLKGSSRMNCRLDQPDEISTFIDARYLSACESVWRLLGFRLLHRSHAVITLPVHVPGAQRCSSAPQML
jgi:hypothetical protein